MPTRVGAYGPAIDKKTLVQHAKLLSRLGTIAPNFAFTAAAIRSALLGVASMKQQAWGFSDGDCKQWSCDLQERLRRMCRHVAQAKIKPTPPKWLAFVLSQTGAVDATSGCVAEDDLPAALPKTGQPPPADQQAAYLVGWDGEQEAAWRVAADADTAEREFTKLLHESTSGDGFAVVARCCCVLFSYDPPPKPKGK